MKLIKLVILLSLAISFSSCEGPRSYIKTNPFISFTDSVGQSELSGTLGFNRAEGMFSYSPIQHIDLRTQGFFGSIGNAYDFSLGLYHRVNIVRLACYGGVGRADMKETKRDGQTHGSGDDDPLQHVYGRFEKIFVQPEIGFYTSPNIRVGYSARISFVEYRHLRYSQTSFSGTSPRPEYTLFKGTPEGTVVEHQMFYRHTAKNHFITLQLGIAQDDFGGEYPAYARGIISLSYGLKLIPRSMLQRKR